jgi:hypothetical protein
MWRNAGAGQLFGYRSIVKEWVGRDSIATLPPLGLMIFTTIVTFKISPTIRSDIMHTEVALNFYGTGNEIVFQKKLSLQSVVCTLLLMGVIRDTDIPLTKRKINWKNHQMARSLV